MYVNTHLLGDAIGQSGMPLWELASRVGVSPDEVAYVDNLQAFRLVCRFGSRRYSTSLRGTCSAAVDDRPSP